MINLIELFLRDFCEPTAKQTKPGKLCYKVVKYSWHLLADLSQTVSVLDDGTFCIQVWYKGSSPVHCKVMPKTLNIRTLQLSLIQQAKEESQRWMKDKNTIERYQIELGGYINSIEKAERSKADLYLIGNAIEQAIVVLEKMNRFDKGIELEESELLGDIHRDLDEKMRILYLLLGNNKGDREDEIDFDTSAHQK